MNKNKNIKITEEKNAAKKLNNNKIVDDNDNKIIDDNDNDSDNDNDFYYILNNHKIFKCILISIKQD